MPSAEEVIENQGLVTPDVFCNQEDIEKKVLDTPTFPERSTTFTYNMEAPSGGATISLPLLAQFAVEVETKLSYE